MVLGRFFLFSFIFSFIWPGIFANQRQDSKPLLRVFPIYRPYECEWAIRMFICYRCVRKGERYAQKIYFYKNGPYRVHGCYSEKKGFYASD